MSKRLSLLGLLALCACGISPSHETLQGATLPPISRDYRTRILAWAGHFYDRPHTLRSTQISDPILIRDSTGRLLWLVCIEADAQARDGRYLGPRRQAFGFAPDYMSSPLERNGATIIRQTCDEHPLVWHRWPALARR